MSSSNKNKTKQTACETHICFSTECYIKYIQPIQSFSGCFALYHSYYSYRIVNRIVRYSALILLFKWKKSLERHFNKCQTVPSRNDTELTGRESVKHIPCSTRLIFVQIVAAPIWTETNLILHKSLAFQLCTEPTQACQPLTMLN